MNTVKIIVTGGIGREVNPHPNNRYNVHHREFESNVKSYPVINPQGDGQYTARKIWQMEDPETKEWYHVYHMAHLMEDKDSPVREVWEIVEGEAEVTNIQQLAEAYASKKHGEGLPSWDADKKLWHRRNIENCRDYFIAGYKAAQEVNEDLSKAINDKLITIGNGLDEHIALLKELNNKIKDTGNHWDYQTAAESNEAIVDIYRLLEKLK